MNQPSYWEARFPGADCTKYENHSGVIPSWVDIAIVHDGQYVRVYNPAPGFVLGPHNPNTGNHFGAPHSWVMKCSVETTTTTTAPTTTTTEQQTTTTFVEDTTTTAVEPTTTTVPPSTTTTTGDSTTLPVCEGAYTSDGELVCLPFTGPPSLGWLALAGSAALLAGLVIVARRET